MFNFLISAKVYQAGFAAARGLLSIMHPMRIEIGFLTMVLAVATLAPAVVLAAGGPVAQPSATKTYTLYGDGTAGQNGWGFTVNTVTYPGPTLYANQGDTVSLSLFSKDGMGHIFVVDWNSDGIKNGADVNSTQFSSTTTATAFSFTADQTGTHQYFCSLHGVGLQKGPLIVNATGGGGTPSSDNTTLIIGGVVIVVAIVAVVAAIAMRRKKP